jgi:tRNA wybutosine-synthesizing protein 2
METTDSRSFLPREPKAKVDNPIEGAIRVWLEALPKELVLSCGLGLDKLVKAAPKRWVVYPPMILLPSGSFGLEFFAQFQTLDEKCKDILWRTLLDRIGRKEGKSVLTHLAINSGIPLNKGGGEEENNLRTPSGLVVLYGDFGPNIPPLENPNQEEFERAFWVSTKQNGIIQTWAPRYTMFSRGNVKEKARLINFHGPGQLPESRRVEKDVLKKQSSVDLYAGIGYFVFSYVKIGMRRVLGWELNPWSVEGLRRGALANGWSVKVVREHEMWEEGDEKIVVFLEDNGKAKERLETMNTGALGEVSHVNGGLLPTSEASWKMSLEILENDGWLHLHENVGVNDTQKRKVEIEEMLRSWLRDKEDQRLVEIEHVEFVKSFAPGVWHCVFDVYISRP